MQKEYVKTSWFVLTNVLVTIAIAVLLIGSFTWMQSEPADISELEKDIAALDEKIDAGISVDVLLDEGVLTTEIHDKLFEDDAWESEAEVIATEEYERRDYKYIAKAIVDIEDRDDIDKVIVKDVNIISRDADDKNAVIETKLKVYYEDISGDDKKIYLTVNTVIEDGEVETQSITETD